MYITAGTLPGKRDNFSRCEQKSYLTGQNVFSLTEKGPQKSEAKGGGACRGYSTRRQS